MYAGFARIVFHENLGTLKRFVSLMMNDVLPQADPLAKWRGADDDALHRKLRLKAVWLEFDQDLARLPVGGMLWPTSGCWFYRRSCTVAAANGRLHKVWLNGELPLTNDRVTLLPCPHYAHLVPPRDMDWFQGLERLKSEMDATSYDVALIGAGAWSLPLAVHAKKQGKVGVHLRGTTQLVFGITGERWRRFGMIPAVAADVWIPPLSEDTPKSITHASAGFRKDCAYW